MFEIITVAVFIWLMVKSIGLVFKLTWGMAKIIAGILMVLALPALALCLIFAGGLALLIPLGLVCFALGILKTCA